MTVEEGKYILAAYDALVDRLWAQDNVFLRHNRAVANTLRVEVASAIQAMVFEETLLETDPGFFEQPSPSRK